MSGQATAAAATAAEAVRGNGAKHTTTDTIWDDVFDSEVRAAGPAAGSSAAGRSGAEAGDHHPSTRENPGTAVTAAGSGRSATGEKPAKTATGADHKWLVHQLYGDSDDNKEGEEEEEEDGQLAVCPSDGDTSDGVPAGAGRHAGVSDGQEPRPPSGSLERTAGHTTDRTETAQLRPNDPYVTQPPHLAMEHSAGSGGGGDPRWWSGGNQWAAPPPQQQPPPHPASEGHHWSGTWPGVTAYGTTGMMPVYRPGMGAWMPPEYGPPSHLPPASHPGHYWSSREEQHHGGWDRRYDDRRSGRDRHKTSRDRSRSQDRDKDRSRDRRSNESRVNSSRERSSRETDGRDRDRSQLRRDRDKSSREADRSKREGYDKERYSQQRYRDYKSSRYSRESRSSEKGVEKSRDRREKEKDRDYDRSGDGELYDKSDSTEKGKNNYNDRSGKSHRESSKHHVYSEKEKSLRSEKEGAKLSRPRDSSSSGLSHRENSSRKAHFDREGNKIEEQYSDPRENSSRDEALQRKSARDKPRNIESLDSNKKDEERDRTCEKSTKRKQNVVVNKKQESSESSSGSSSDSDSDSDSSSSSSGSSSSSSSSDSDSDSSEEAKDTGPSRKEKNVTFEELPKSKTDVHSNHNSDNEEESSAKEENCSDFTGHENPRHTETIDRGHKVNEVEEKDEGSVSVSEHTGDDKVEATVEPVSKTTSTNETASDDINYIAGTVTKEKDLVETVETDLNLDVQENQGCTVSGEEIVNIEHSKEPEKVALSEELQFENSQPRLPQPRQLVLKKIKIKLKSRTQLMKQKKELNSDNGLSTKTVQEKRQTSQFKGKLVGPKSSLNTNSTEKENQSSLYHEMPEAAVQESSETERTMLEKTAFHEPDLGECTDVGSIPMPYGEPTEKEPISTSETASIQDTSTAEVVQNNCAISPKNAISENVPKESVLTSEESISGVNMGDVQLTSEISADLVESVNPIEDSAQIGVENEEESESRKPNLKSFPEMSSVNSDCSTELITNDNTDSVDPCGVGVEIGDYNPGLLHSQSTKDAESDSDQAHHVEDLKHHFDLKVQSDTKVQSNDEQENTLNCDTLMEPMDIAKDVNKLETELSVSEADKEDVDANYIPEEVRGTEDAFLEKSPTPVIRRKTPPSDGSQVTPKIEKKKNRDKKCKRTSAVETENRKEITIGNGPVTNVGALRAPIDLPMPAFAKYFGFSPKKGSFNSTANSAENGLLVNSKQSPITMQSPDGSVVLSPTSEFSSFIGSAPCVSEAKSVFISTNHGKSDKENVDGNSRDPRIAARQKREKAKASAQAKLDQILTSSSCLSESEVIQRGNASRLPAKEIIHIGDVLMQNTTLRVNESTVLIDELVTNKSKDEIQRRDGEPVTADFYKSPEKSFVASKELVVGNSSQDVLSGQSDNNNSAKPKPRKHTKWSQWKASHSLGELYKGNKEGLTVLPQGVEILQSSLPEGKTQALSINNSQPKQPPKGVKQSVVNKVSQSQAPRKKPKAKGNDSLKWIQQVEEMMKKIEQKPEEVDPGKEDCSSHHVEDSAGLSKEHSKGSSDGELKKMTQRSEETITEEHEVSHKNEFNDTEKNTAVEENYDTKSTEDLGAINQLQCEVKEQGLISATRRLGNEGAGPAIDVDPDEGREEGELEEEADDRTLMGSPCRGDTWCSNPHYAQVNDAKTVINTSGQDEAMEDKCVESYAEENVVNESYPEENVVNESYPEENVVNESYPEEDVVNESYPEENVVNESCLEDNVVNESYPEENVVNESYPEEDVVNESYPEENVVNESCLEDNVVNESYPEDNVVNESCPEDNLVNESYPEDNVVNESCPEDNLVNESYPEDNVVNESYPEENVIDESYPEEPVVNESYPEEHIVNDCRQDTLPAVSTEFLASFTRADWDSLLKSAKAVEKQKEKVSNEKMLIPYSNGSNSNESRTLSSSNSSSTLSSDSSSSTCSSSNSSSGSEKMKRTKKPKKKKMSSANANSSRSTVAELTSDVCPSQGVSVQSVTSIARSVESSRTQRSSCDSHVSVGSGSQCSLLSENGNKDPVENQVYDDNPPYVDSDQSAKDKRSLQKAQYQEFFGTDSEDSVHEFCEDTPGDVPRKPVYHPIWNSRHESDADSSLRDLRGQSQSSLDVATLSEETEVEEVKMADYQPTPTEEFPKQDTVSAHFNETDFKENEFNSGNNTEDQSNYERYSVGQSAEENVDRQSCYSVSAGEHESHPLGFQSTEEVFISDDENNESVEKTSIANENQEIEEESVSEYDGESQNTDTKPNERSENEMALSGQENDIEYDCNENEVESVNGDSEAADPSTYNEERCERISDDNDCFVVEESEEGNPIVEDEDEKQNEFEITKGDIEETFGPVGDDNDCLSGNKNEEGNPVMEDADLREHELEITKEVEIDTDDKYDSDYGDKNLDNNKGIIDLNDSIEKQEFDHTSEEILMTNTASSKESEGNENDASASEALEQEVDARNVSDSEVNSLNGRGESVGKSSETLDTVQEDILRTSIDNVNLDLIGTERLEEGKQNQVVINNTFPRDKQSTPSCSPKMSENDNTLTNALCPPTASLDRQYAKAINIDVQKSTRDMSVDNDDAVKSTQRVDNCDKLSKTESSVMLNSCDKTSNLPVSVDKGSSSNNNKHSKISPRDCSDQSLSTHSRKVLGNKHTRAKLIPQTIVFEDGPPGCGSDEVRTFQNVLGEKTPPKRSASSNTTQNPNSLSNRGIKKPLVPSGLALSLDVPPGTESVVLPTTLKVSPGGGGPAGVDLTAPSVRNPGKQGSSNLVMADIKNESTPPSGGNCAGSAPPPVDRTRHRRRKRLLYPSESERGDCYEARSGGKRGRSTSPVRHPPSRRHPARTRRAARERYKRSRGRSRHSDTSEERYSKKRGKRRAERYRARSKKQGKSTKRQARSSSTSSSSSSACESSSSSSYERPRHRRRRPSWSPTSASSSSEEKSEYGRRKTRHCHHHCKRCRLKRRYSPDTQDFFNRRALAGYCFVEFPSPEAANYAMLRLSGKVVPGSSPAKRFKLNHASYGKEHLLVPEYSLFVGDLSEDVDDLILFQAFSKKFPSCRAAKVVHDNDCRSRGYGFVRFTDESDQQKALVEMQNYVGIGSKPIRVSPATPKRPAHPGGHPGMNNYQPNYWPGYYGYGGMWGPPGYNSGNQGYGYGPYGMSASYGQDQAGTSMQSPGSDQYQGDQTDNIEEDEVLEDPMVPLDIDKANREFMEQSEEFYTALEASRWQPLDNVMSAPTAKVH